MHFQPRFHVIALSAILACATPWFATRADAQSLKLPQSTEGARSAWMEDCTIYRSQRDRLEREQRDNAVAQKDIVANIAGNNMMIAGIRDRMMSREISTNRERGFENAHYMEGVFEIQREHGPRETPESKAKLVRLSKEHSERLELISKRGDDAVAVMRQEMTKFELEVRKLQQRLNELVAAAAEYPQQIQAAQQAFDDCTKRQATARSEITPLDDKVMELLTALILQGSIDQWGETVIGDIKKEEEKTKRQDDAVRRIKQKVTGGGGHDPTASMILETGIEVGIGAAIKAGTRKDRRITPPVDGGGTPSKGGCTGGACPR